MTIRDVAKYGSVLIAAAVSWWLLNSDTEQTTPLTDTELNDAYYLIDATIEDLDGSGNVVYSLRAQRIDHSPAQGDVRLSELEVLYAGTNAQDWTITATRGTMGAAREKLNLHGDVSIVALDPDGQEQTRIRTSRLSLDIPKNIAKTSELVDIEIAGGSLQATGLRADLAAQRIELLADVHGEFGGKL